MTRVPSTALAYNLYLKHDLQQVSRAFAERRIPWMVIKGVALAETVYRGLAERPMVDNDIVVPKERVVEAHRVLLALGFYDRPQCTLELALGADYEHQMHYTHPDVETGMELHWHLYPPELFRGSVGDYFQRAVTRRLTGIYILTLSNEDRLLQAATHWAAHGLCKPSVLTDIELLWNLQELAEHALVLELLTRTLRAVGAFHVFALALLLLEQHGRLQRSVPDSLRSRRAEAFARVHAARLARVMTPEGGPVSTTEEHQLRLLSWALLSPQKALTAVRRELLPSVARLSRIAGRRLTAPEAARYFGERQGRALRKVLLRVNDAGNVEVDDLNPTEAVRPPSPTRA